MPSKLLQLLHDVESVWQEEIEKLSDQELADFSRRCQSMGQVFEVDRRRRESQQKEKDHRKELKRREESLKQEVITPEVMRQVLPFLTAKEVGRCLIMTNKNMVDHVGRELVWKTVCHKIWGHDIMGSNSIIGALHTYEKCFRERQKPFSLASETLLPIHPTQQATSKMCLLIDVWKGPDLIWSTVLSNLNEFCEEARCTIPLQNPIVVGQLPRNKGYPFHLPDFFEAKDGRARIQLFRIGETDRLESMAGDRSIASSVVLDTKFTYWRGFGSHGVMAFLQRQRTVGLQLTSRGQWIQHRIHECKHPQWMRFRGLQFKLVLICELLQRPQKDDQTVTYAFTKANVEAIRLHEDAHKNIQHHLFRKDQGWEKHGVTLMHLLEELK